MDETPKYITLTEAAKVAPGRPSTSCLWRWCRKGVISRNGERVRLKHAQIRAEAVHHGWLGGSCR